MERSRYVVVGAGLAGAATAFSLARRGAEVTIVERTRPAAPDGSSHGSARILRYAYTDPFYTDLVVRAKEGFDELERLGGSQLVTPTGGLDFGAAGDPRLLAGVLGAAGVPHELLSRDQARERWPEIAVDSEVLWHPGAGVIDAETTVDTQVRLAEQLGAQLLAGWELRSATRAGAGYRLVSADGRVLEAENIVVAAGGWLPALLSDLALPTGFLAQVPALQVRQEQAHHFPYREQSGAPVGTVADRPRPLMPTFIHHRDGIETYGLPGGRDADHRGQKVAEFAAGRVLASAREQDGLVDPGKRARLVEYVRRYLPGLVPEPYAETTCLFTTTPSEDFVLDRADGVTLVSPCSGHGAKFTPVVGELAADIAMGGAGPARFTLAELASAGNHRAAAHA